MIEISPEAHAALLQAIAEFDMRPDPVVLVHCRPEMAVLVTDREVTKVRFALGQPHKCVYAKKGVLSRPKEAFFPVIGLTVCLWPENWWQMHLKIVLVNGELFAETKGSRRSH